MRCTIIDKRYKVLKKLGAGAMGAVYKVEDLKNDKIIALKLLSRKKTSSETVQRFKREFRLLAGLHHPNLCEVYDFGTLKDSRSYFTMEYIDGPDIFAFTQKLPYEKMYPVIVQLCRVLEYIHSKGLIHYDIKPGNILIAKGNTKHYAQSPMHQAKLMDFGLAREHQLEGRTLMRGTLPYIAPEVIKGLSIDHRADLYSLGILLYEIFTRKHLTIDDETSFVTFIEKQEQISKRPLTFASRVPTEMRQLIMRLLSIDPAARYSRANAIITKINKSSRTKFAIETDTTLEGYLLSSQFVGRDKEMELLKSLYDKARRGNGTILLIAGDVGIGKSRLLREFKILVQTQRGYCFTGSAYKNKVRSFEPFYDIFKGLTNYIKLKPKLSYELKLAFAILFKIFPDLTIKHLKKKLPELVPLEPKQEILRTFESLSELIGYYASVLGALVILLEDLHWADDLSIQFLEYLSRNLEGKSIFICATSRKEGLTKNAVLKKMVSSLRKEVFFEQIELRPLTFRGLYSFLDSTITPVSNSSELVRYFMKKTDGNPIFVEEVMRTLLRSGVVAIGEKIDIAKLYRIPVPTTIEDVVLNRIKDVDRRSRTILKFGAVFLRDFTYTLLRELTRLNNTELSKILQELKRTQIILEHNNTYSFYHATLREAIVNRLKNREKRKLCYHIGKTLEKINRKRIGQLVEDLAYYFINAKNSEKGIIYGLRAAQKSRKQYANEQAIRFYRGVLGLLGQKNRKRRFDILHKLAQLEKFVGLYDNAIKHYKEALALKTNVIDEINASIEYGIIYELKGEYNNALRVYAKIKELLIQKRYIEKRFLLKKYIEARIFCIHQRMGNYKKLANFSLNDVKMLQGSKSKEVLRLLSDIYNSMGNIEYQKGEYQHANYDKAISYFERACSYCTQVNAKADINAILINIGLCYYLKYDYNKALIFFKKAIQVSKKTGNQRNISVGLFNAGLVFLEKDCYIKAMDCYQGAYFLAKKIGDHLLAGVSVGSQGWCFFNLCEYNRAKECFEEALRTFDALQLKARKAYQILGIGVVYKALGEYTLALKFYRRSIKILRKAGNLYYVLDSLIDVGLLFLEIGEIPSARRYITDAMDIATTIGIRAKSKKAKCYIGLCRISIMMKEYDNAYTYYNKGLSMAREIQMKHEVLQFFIINSEISYYRKKYWKSIKIADRSIAIAKKMNAKVIHVEALLMKAKNEIKRDVLTKIEIFTILNEAKRIAEEIRCPELLWKVYLCYGQYLQEDRQYLKASEYYQRCHSIFKDVGGKIKNKSYQNSYFAHPDRQEVYAAIDEIEKLVRSGG